MSKDEDKQEVFLKRILYICCLVYAITLAYAMYQNIMAKDYATLGMSVVALLLPFAVPLLFRLFHFQPVYEIYIVAVVFIYFASLLGSSFFWYSYPGFDKVVHFFSGFMFLLAAVMLFFYLRKSDIIKTKEDRNVWIVFINAVNLAIAVCWEFYEYSLLVFFDNDAIRHYASGVHDSMTDMLCAGSAGVIMTIYIVYNWKRNKTTFITNIYKKFYQRNIERK